MADVNINSEMRNVNDGFFEITFNSDGIYLIVYPHVGKGRPVELRDVLDKLVKKQVRGFYKEIIETAVQRCEKLPVKIAEHQEEIKLDATVSVSTSPDKMKGYVTLHLPEGGRTLTLEEILEQVSSYGIIYNINKTTVENLARFPVYNEMVCIAEGTPPVNGNNGRIEFFFDTDKQSKPTILEDGRVDYKSLNIVTNARKGEPLCKLVPPSTGTPGKTIFGDEIPALNGKPANLPKGKNVQASDDCQLLFAGIDGEVNYIEGKVNVYANYEIPADVGSSTGNINFIGNITVRGNVLSGFSIEAGGNVEVMGVVEGAVIKAGGDIILRRGMQGIEKGILISGGDIIARYIEHSHVEAKGNIKSEAIMHSTVKCGNKLELSGRKGLLVGGNVKVGKEIDARVIGSPMATATDLEVGVDPTVRERYKQVREEISSSEIEMKKADQAIEILKKLEQMGKLTSEKQEIYAKSVRIKIFLTNRVNELKEELYELDAKLQSDSQGRVKAGNVIYPGTKVTIGAYSMSVKENLHFCTLYREGADVRVGEYNK